jgi:hypothetical protein
MAWSTLALILGRQMGAWMPMQVSIRPLKMSFFVGRNVYLGWWGLVTQVVGVQRLRVSGWIGIGDHYLHIGKSLSTLGLLHINAMIRLQY